MGSDYPPLARPGIIRHARRHSLTNAPTTGLLLSTKDPNHFRNSSPKAPIVVSTEGDVILKYTNPSSTESCHWKVESNLLMRNSPYFRALMDPNKFSEGRFLAQVKKEPSTQDALPIVVMPASQFTEMCGTDALELFLQILCLDSVDFFDFDELKEFDWRRLFLRNLKTQSPSLISRLIEVADLYNSPHFIRETLKKVGYMFGRSKPQLGKFSPTILKASEDRIRQTLVVAEFLGEYHITKIMTHTLVVIGSKYWTDGTNVPTSPYFRWQYLPHGLEEEIYFRRQCVLNTITDLQAYFLRAYGALEEIDEPKETKPPSLGVAFITSHQHRHFQCRGGFGNASQCDLFHLGQMTRFFALRAKTIFIGSTLIDPDFGLSSDEDEEDEKGRSISGPASDITALVASLKQYPDYQIDLNHQGCGVRRRLLPVLDGIERFILDSRGLLGVNLHEWENVSLRPSIAWSNRNSQADHKVDIRFAKITAVQFPSQAASPARQFTQEEDAWLLFTAKKRNWES
ncbi:hypothetical protein N7462_005988 [Penicillium macrosclerotiorum]|uniref:uncharacterized protein n=1 Tax=Penicillium macrosclerotiorum TaxID=303699 RepID=UPI002548FFA4|nr:uncharacterized protein N7462_005988 [Penicillium macrosclerotiorum]KAJ5682823.1 hypothetical protein N7462_005988 [Penicillium macrosclerotiorum]